MVNHQGEFYFMDQFENLKTNFNRTVDNLLNELSKTKEIVAAIADKDLICEPIIITSEELISVDSENVEKSLVNRLESLGNKQNCIYIFELENENNIEAVKNKFKQKKDEKDEKDKKEQKFQYNLPKNNKVKNSNVLYVGSKKDKLQKRLYQHLGINLGDQKGGTYALYLSKWWQKDFPNVKITAYSLQEDVSYTQLVFIEDCFSEMLNPLFGKKGSNSK